MHCPRLEGIEVSLKAGKLDDGSCHYPLRRLTKTSFKEKFTDFYRTLEYVCSAYLRRQVDTFVGGRLTRAHISEPAKGVSYGSDDYFRNELPFPSSERTTQAAPSTAEETRT